MAQAESQDKGLRGNGVFAVNEQALVSRDTCHSQAIARQSRPACPPSPCCASPSDSCNSCASVRGCAALTLSWPRCRSQAVWPVPLGS